MPDKQESFLAENVPECSGDYQDLALSQDGSKKSISVSEGELGGHTSFPVDLKEVFELTNPTHLRTTQLAYSLIPKENGVVTWRHVLRDSQDMRTSSWDIGETESGDEVSLLRSGKSVITVPESWTHVAKQPPPQEGDKPAKVEEPTQVAVITVQPPWPHLVKQDRKPRHMLASNGAWGEILEPELDHSVMGDDQDKGWAHLLSSPPDQDPVDLSGDVPQTRDASCQASEEGKGDEGPSPVDFEGPVVPHNAAIVHDGIKPELYMQERHLLVQVGAKAQFKDKTSPSHTCSHCNKVFSDARSLQRHSQLHASPVRQYGCEVCGKTFTLNGDLTRHARIHSGEKPYPCDICGRRFTLKGNLMQHLRTHAPDKQYACTLCEKNYAQRDSLHRHIRAHFGERPFQCATCAKRFTLKGDLSHHILIHSGLKPHACGQCGRQFALKGNLTQHVRTHTRQLCHPEKSSISEGEEEMSVICDLSHQKPPLYAALEGLPLPMEEDKTSPSQAESCPSPPSAAGLSFCSECSKTFPSPDALHTHVRLIHEQSTRLSPHRHLCNICRKEFHLKGDLTRHLDSHNGVRPYACELCGRAFTLKSNLRQHLATHATSSRNFACHLCRKAFGNRRNLNLHLRRHEQARANFACTRCGRSFLAKSDHFFHDCQADEDAVVEGNLVMDKVAPLVADEDVASVGQEQVCCTRCGKTFPAKSDNFFHDCNPVADEVAHPVADQAAPPDSATPPESPHVDVLCPSDSVVKSESCLVEEEQDVLGDPVLVNGSVLGPFYRHLYFSASPQTVIPALKSLLHVTTETADFDRGKDS